MVKETPGLTKRLLAEHVSRGELHGIVNVITEAIQAVQTRLAVVESRGLRFRGAFQRADDYRRNEVCLHAGSAWVCLKDAPSGTAVPGKSESAAHWMLFEKAAQSAGLKSFDIELNRKVEVAKRAASEAASAAARIAVRSAANAEAASKARKQIEITRVVEHDSAGRIVRFEKEVVEREDANP